MHFSLSFSCSFFLKLVFVLVESLIADDIHLELTNEKRRSESHSDSSRLSLFFELLDHGTLPDE